MKIYISPSLQDQNVGVGSYGTEEKRMNQLANVLIPILIQSGHTVYRNKTEMTLLQAVADSNSKKVDLHIALHSNAFNGLSRGCLVFCHKFGGPGEKYARSIYRYLEPLTPSTDQGVKEGYNYFGSGKPLYETAYTNAPAVLIEVAFHDNLSDANWIINNTTPIAHAIANGINELCNVTTVPTTDYKIKYDNLVMELSKMIEKYGG
jgi:N-acetylmuramoyl-L-alanine amidase